MPKIVAKLQKNLKKFEGIETNYNYFASKRNVSIFTQFWAIFVRNWIFLIRNPKAQKAIVFQAAFMALLMLALFYKVGEVD